MYWPIGAPRIYAASNHALSREPTLLASDDADSKASLLESSLPDSDRDSEAVVAVTGEPKEGGRTAQDPATKGKNKEVSDPQSRPDTPRDRDGVEDGSDAPLTQDDGAIIALRASRSGHLFATITTTTLTIWQTRVCLCVLASVPLC